MDYLPDEMVGEIVRMADYDIRFELTRVNKQFLRHTLRYVIPIYNIDEFKMACRVGDILSVSRQDNRLRYWLQKGLETACKSGHMEIVKLLLKKVPEWSISLRHSIFKRLRGGIWGLDY